MGFIARPGGFFDFVLSNIVLGHGVWPLFGLGPSLLAPSVLAGFSGWPAAAPFGHGLVNRSRDPFCCLLERLSHFFRQAVRRDETQGLDHRSVALDSFPRRFDHGVALRRTMAEDSKKNPAPLGNSRAYRFFNRRLDFPSLSVSFEIHRRFLPQG